eukprot:scaffold229321_cov27-Tisochrysis_lutea.AAC.2
MYCRDHPQCRAAKHVLAAAKPYQLGHSHACLRRRLIGIARESTRRVGRPASRRAGPPSVGLAAIVRELALEVLLHHGDGIHRGTLRVDVAGARFAARRQ